MSHEAFTNWTPRSHNNRVLLVRGTGIIEEYAAQGYQLTLRQLYYQMVSRDIIPNSTQWYRKLGEVVSNGRMAGYIDWNAIVDRGRLPYMPPDWKSPADPLQTAAHSYRVDRWQGQPHLVEVWCEKDALSGVIEPVCNRYHVRMLANRGYSSSTAMYQAAQRFNQAADEGQQPVVLYLGDHDPSGTDMTRDVRARLETMTRKLGVEVKRLALNHDQIKRYKPPPNPVKIKDSRARKYISVHGAESWELDALEPQVLDNLISSTIETFIEPEQYARTLREEEKGKEAIIQAAKAIQPQDPQT